MLCDWSGLAAHAAAGGPIPTGPDHQQCCCVLTYEALPKGASHKPAWAAGCAPGGSRPAAAPACEQLLISLFSCVTQSCCGVKFAVAIAFSMCQSMLPCILPQCSSTFSVDLHICQELYKVNTSPAVYVYCTSCMPNTSIPTQYAPLSYLVMSDEFGAASGEMGVASGELEVVRWVWHVVMSGEMGVASGEMHVACRAWARPACIAEMASTIS